MRVLQLGCGVRPIEGAVNHDRERHHDYVDVAHDLDILPWPWADESFDRIIALDVMEHLKLDVQQWLDECWRVLVPDGVLVLRLPAWDHECSHRDPTHRLFAHPEMFHYWDRHTQLYRDYGSYYFARSNRWWRVESVEPRDAGANWGYVLCKEAE